jgi:hypothetical protein
MKIGSLAELFAQVREQPEQAQLGDRDRHHDFLFAAFLKNTGLDMSKVSSDTVQASTDLAEARIQMYWGALAIVRPQVQAGKARLIAFSNSARAPDEPDVPTVTEAGYPALKFDGLVGLFGPRDLADDIRERIAADVKEVAADPLIAARLASTARSSALTPGGIPPRSSSSAGVAAIARDGNRRRRGRSRRHPVGPHCAKQPHASRIVVRLHHRFRGNPGRGFEPESFTGSVPASRRDSRRSHAGLAPSQPASTYFTSSTRRLHGRFEPDEASSPRGLSMG